MASAKEDALQAFVAQIHLSCACFVGPSWCVVGARERSARSRTHARAARTSQINSFLKRRIGKADRLHSKSLDYCYLDLVWLFFAGQAGSLMASSPSARAAAGLLLDRGRRGTEHRRKEFRKEEPGYVSAAPIAPPFNGSGRQLPRILDHKGQAVSPRVVLHSRVVVPQPRPQLQRICTNDSNANDYEADKEHFRARAEAFHAACQRKVAAQHERKLATLAEVLLSEPVPAARRESVAIVNPLTSSRATLGRHYHLDEVWSRAAINPPCSAVTQGVVEDFPAERRNAVEKAAAEHDERYRSLLIRAGRLEYSARNDETSIKKSNALRAATREFRRHRYFVNEVSVQATPSHMPARAQKAVATEAPWSLSESIWAERAEWCDSEDFYDTEECERRRFGNVWQRALSIGLGQFVVKQDDGDDDTSTPDNDEIPDEVQEVEHVLWQNASLMFSIFNVYAALGDSITTMEFNEWSEMVKDLKLANGRLRHCKSVDLDRIFIAVDAASAKFVSAEESHSTAQHDRRKSLSIAEFLYALVRIAVARFITSGSETDVSQAVHSLFVEVLEPPSLTNEFLRSDSNLFRERFCYLEDVDRVLRRHEPSLRAIFKTIAIEDKLLPKALREQIGPLVTFECWRLFVRSLGLIQSDLSDREANFCFVASRMSISNPYSARGHVMASGLAFEDFLEAMVRVAGLKGLPDDDDIVSGGFRDAGEMMLYLRANDVPRYERTVLNCSQWGEEPLQPIARCVDHLLSIVVRQIEAKTSGDDDMCLTGKEVKSWWQEANDRA